MKNQQNNLIENKTRILNNYLNNSKIKSFSYHKLNKMKLPNNKND